MDNGTLDVASLFKAIREMHISSNSPTEILEIFLDNVVEVLNAERGFILLYDAGTKNLKPYACHNVDPDFLFIGELISLTVINSAFLEEKAILISDALDDPRFANMTSVVLSQLRSVVCVPISNEKGVLGIIYVDNRFKKGFYKAEHLQFLKESAQKLSELIVEKMPDIQFKSRA
jgi:GAF domain-containing protein